MRALHAAVVAVSVAALCAGGAQAATPTDQQKVASIEQVTSQLRGLTALHSVPSQILGNTAFNAVLRAQIKRDTPDAEIALNQREERVLGLLGSKDNLRSLTYGAQVKDIIGVYDYITKKLYVRNSKDLAFGIDRYVLAHEYTHALQDQHFHLNAFLPDQYPLQYRDSDMVEAHRALTEGDAVNTQYMYIQREYTRDQLRALLASQNSEHAPPMPKSMSRESLFPYTTGYDFVRSLYKAGGESKIDQAYVRPPSSTYEIMHPTAYLRGWRPDEVPLHSVAGFSGWTQSDDDVVGALGYELLWWQYLGKSRADTVLNSYRGDRYVFLQSGSRAEMLLKSEWTTVKGSVRAERVWVASLKARWRHATVRKRAGATTVSDASGAVYLRASGTLLTAAYAHTAAQAIQLGTAVTT